MHTGDQVESQTVSEVVLKKLQETLLDLALVGKAVHHIPGARRGRIFRGPAGLSYLAVQDGDAVFLEDTGLTDDLVEDHGWDGPGLNQIPEDIARTDRGKLVVVTYKYDGGSVKVNSLE